MNSSDNSTRALTWPSARENRHHHALQVRRCRNPQPLNVVTPEERMDEVPPETITAIEVYSNRTGIPGVFYGSQSICGVVGIWTAHG